MRRSREDPHDLALQDQLSFGGAVQALSLDLSRVRRNVEAPALQSRTA
jgi:hypothetical protein